MNASPRTAHDRARTRSPRPRNIGTELLRIAPLACLCSVALAGTTARATNPDCDTLPNPTYGTGGSAETPLVGALAKALAAQNITVIYAAPSACTGLTTLLNDSGAITSTVNYWDSSGNQLSCNLPAGIGVPAD